MTEVEGRQIQISECIGEIPSWGLASALALRRQLQSSKDPFPCTFAVAANKQRALRFGFIEDLFDDSTWDPIPNILDAYIGCYRDLGRQTSLVLFFRPMLADHQLDKYFERFWAVLQYLHDHDKASWPEELPPDPDNALWQFAYGGCPFFVVCSNPAHRLRRSRSSAGFFITFQPHRWVFEGLGGDTPRGIAVRRIIKDRLRRFDGTAPSPLLGVYGDASNREWKQYLLPDSNRADWASCPFRNRDSDERRNMPSG